jgi:hypothetical protein
MSDVLNNRKTWVERGLRAAADKRRIQIEKDHWEPE